MTDLCESSDSDFAVVIPGIAELFIKDFIGYTFFSTNRNAKENEVLLKLLGLHTSQCKKNNAICGSGVRLRAGQHVHCKTGEPVHIVDTDKGICIHESNEDLLHKCIQSKPTDVGWNMWVGVFMRKNYINVFTTGLKGAVTGGTQEYEKLLNSPMLGKRPDVTIVTPTYNRKAFLPRLVECVKHQNLGTLVVELVILDDSEEGLSRDEQQSLWGEAHFPVLYSHMTKKLFVGNKRNILSEMSIGKYIINFDDDDLHHPDRIKHSVKKLVRSKCPLVGCTRCLISFEGDIYEIAGYHERHSTGGLMAFTRNFGVNNRFGEGVTNGEEAEFTNKFSKRLVQLDGNKVILIMCHAENTFDKTEWMNKNIGKNVKKTSLKTKNFTSNRHLCKMFGIS